MKKIYILLVLLLSSTPFSFGEQGVKTKKNGIIPGRFVLTYDSSLPNNIKNAKSPTLSQELLGLASGQQKNSQSYDFLDKLFREIGYRMLPNSPSKIRVQEFNKISKDKSIVKIKSILVEAETIDTSTGGVSESIKIAQKLAEITGFKVENDYWVNTFEVGEDPYVNSRFFLWSGGLKDLWGLHRVQAPQVWAQSEGSGIKVAVLDTGVDAGHPDLEGNVLEELGFNFVDFNTNTDDFIGHGTHVAGTIAAVKGNAIGIAGVAPQAKIIPVKVLGENGGSLFGVSEGIRFAADKGAKVINMSLGGSFNSRINPSYLEEAIEYALSKDVSIVAAAGNESDLTNYAIPARINGVISVGSTNFDDKISFFSNMGFPTTIFAPGGHDQYGASTILSTRTRMIRPDGTRPYEMFRFGDDYARLMGTSMASPHVAGVIALMRSIKPLWSESQIRSAITASSSDLGEPGYDNIYTNGYINIIEALKKDPIGIKIVEPSRNSFLSSNSPLLIYKLSNPASKVEVYVKGYYQNSYTKIITYLNRASGENRAILDLKRFENEPVLIIKVVATNSKSENYEDIVYLDRNVYSKYVSITHPPAGDYLEDSTVIRKGEIVSIKGSVITSQDTKFSKYKIELFNLKGEVKFSEAIKLNLNGTTPVFNGELGKLDTKIVDAGNYYLKATLFYLDSQNIERSIVSIKDSLISIENNLKSGFPINRNFYISNILPVDINYDNIPEILYSTKNSLKILDLNTKLEIDFNVPLEGYIKSLSLRKLLSGKEIIIVESMHFTESGKYLSKLKLVNFDGEIFKEINFDIKCNQVYINDFIASKPGEEILCANDNARIGYQLLSLETGSLISKLPSNSANSYVYYSNFVLADLDNDKIKDIIYSTLEKNDENGSVKVTFHAKKSGLVLSNVSGFPKIFTTTDIFLSSELGGILTVADFSGDSNFEILLKLNDRKSVVFSNLGVQLSTVSLNPSISDFRTQQIVSDIENDGKSEIIYYSPVNLNSSGEFFGAIDCKKSNNTTCSGVWPYKILLNSGYNYKQLRDFDDPQLRSLPIFSGTLPDIFLYPFHHQLEKGSVFSLRNTNSTPQSITNIISNFIIPTISYSGNENLFFWDVDANGDNEMIVLTNDINESSSKIYIWELPKSNTGTHMKRMWKNRYFEWRKSQAVPNL